MTATYLAGQHPGSSFTSLTVSPVHDHRDALQARPFPCGLSSPIPMLSCDKLPPLLARSATCHSWPVCRRASPRCPTAFPLTLCHARRRGLRVSSLRCRTPCVHGRPACIGGQSMLTTRLPQHAGGRSTDSAERRGDVGRPPVNADGPSDVADRRLREAWFPDVGWVACVHAAVQGRALCSRDSACAAIRCAHMDRRVASKCDFFPRLSNGSNAYFTPTLLSAFETHILQDRTCFVGPRASMQAGAVVHP